MDDVAVTAALTAGGRLERALVRVGVREHVARIIAATPSLRASWVVAAVAGMGFSGWAASAGPRGVVAFLVVAPLLPVAGVAAAYGPWADPMHEMTQASPMAGVRMVLLRSVAVLATTAVIAGVAAVAIPGTDWTAAAWILPALGLTLGSLALSTFMPVHRAAGAVTFLWLAGVLATGIATEDGLDTFRGTGQVVFFLLAVVSSGTLAWRRERLAVRGRATQQGLIDVAEAERKRIERNIHDGAQQQLVAISVKLGVAKVLVVKDPERAIAMLDDLQAEAQEALDGLRDMTRGTYPPVLADHGLGAALEARAKRAPMAVTVSAEGVGRPSREIETAVYYCCLEALQNAGKHARATRATISVRCVGGELAFTVIDDGVGFDMRTMRGGVGTRSMAERMAALGGNVEIRSAPGKGTTIAGRVPLFV
ncbi:MAG: sensor histidine kinase [Actinomycetota bacterium]